MRADDQQCYVHGTGVTPFIPSSKGSDSDTLELLFNAAQDALTDAGKDFSDLDGLGVASFTAAPDRSIDIAVRWNIQPRWLMDSALGGASGNDMLSHAADAIAMRRANTILLIAGDHFAPEDFSRLVRNYNSATRQHSQEIPSAGPNAYFAMVTQMQMAKYGLTREDYGRLAISQRAWASHNPKAAYRSPLTMDDYLSAPMISEPLGRLDCVPVVSGAVALVVSSEPGEVEVLGIEAQHNHDRHDDSGLITGLSQAAPRLWAATGLDPTEVDVASFYDDYPAMVVAQMIDCGIMPEIDIQTSLKSMLEGGTPAINTSGGQLSAGQPGAGAGLHGLVEVSNALRDKGPALLKSARIGLATGYGMVTYRYGSCSNIALLRRSG